MAAWPGGSSFPFVLAAATLIVVLGAAIPYCWYTFTTRSGQIIINSPTIYTRQRLVNDRLNQAEWLQQQLKAADGVESDFRSIDQVEQRFESRNSSVAATIGSRSLPASSPENGDKDPHPDRANATSNGGSQVAAVQATTAALFRAKNAYRDEVRSEMMETQLDDRHDILGNTIYRLAFDATVIPGSRSDDLAVIRIKLSHHPRSDYSIPSQNQASNSNSIPSQNQASNSNTIPSQNQTSNSNKSAPAHRTRETDLKQLYSDDEMQLYGDWKRYMQLQVSNAMTGIANLIATRQPVPSPVMPPSDFLAGRICEFTLGIIRLAPEINDQCQEGRQARSVALKLLNLYASEYIPRDVAAVNNTIVGELKDIGVDSPENSIKRLGKYCRANATKSAPASLVMQPGPDNANFSLAHLPLECPVYDSVSERLLAGISLYSELYEYVTEGNPRPSSNGQDWLKAIESRRKDRQANHVLSDPTLGNLPDRLAATQCFAADFLRAKMDEFRRLDDSHSEQIDNFLTLRIVGREQNDCRLSVVDHIDENSNNDMDRVLGSLDYFLEKDTEAFSYSVTPKSLTQNISSSSDIRDAYQLLLQLHSGVARQDVDGVLNQLDRKSRQAQTLVEHPIVIGFGSNNGPLEPVQPPDRKRFAPSIRSTVFGWAIFPALRDGRLQQGDSQYALTAVVSVPSWWRSAELEVETCWLSRTQLQFAIAAGSQEFDRCASANPERSWTVIHLPGSPQDIANKLGIFVVQEPHIDIVDDHQRLEIYEPGSLLLSGLRLWRSTEVTLGTQLADSITVLPNMEGIIATFRCVLPQAGTDVTNEVVIGVPVRVWTSEGATEVKYVNLNWPADQSGREIAGQARRQVAAADEDNESHQATPPRK